MSDAIKENVDKHERIANDYDARHPEIYNRIEQSRLFESLKHVRSLVDADTPRALDYGCGTGNVTRHLLNLGFDVEAADVTPKFVSIVTKEFADTGRVFGRILNGSNLEGCADHSFDVVTVYSVLHHIPDYLYALKDIARVLKPSGVLFIDHEFAPSYWKPSESLIALRKRTRVPTPLLSYLQRMTSPKWYVKRYRKFLNPRYQEEGDIHVWPDDHIEWDLITSSLSEDMDIISVKDYLYYQTHYPIELFNEYKSKCADLREMILRKRSIAV